ncbi:helix-turn-helix domain-containing protein [Mycolicibacterium komossense]|uniref:Helix-turn-helix domain-containing protein n=1 Tax=Mycolicibacterium komossense TaxID=1779 RepID=A0ABT3CI28_9MYCO|nr:helix-turn-helix domain-containing protein [Mycolicibacterium komossense]MCV7229097.1 helix-turn-helix domain-containing protein [Mycolicibacterium komossense]
MSSFDKFAYLKKLGGYATGSDDRAGADISANEFRVLVTLLNYANGSDGASAYPGVDKLAANCRVSATTVKRCLNRLMEAGYIWKVKTGGRAGDGRCWATEYAFHTSPPISQAYGVHARSQQPELNVSGGQTDDVNSSNQRVKGSILTPQQLSPVASEAHSYDPPPEHLPPNQITPREESPDHEPTGHSAPGARPEEGTYVCVTCGTRGKTVRYGHPPTCSSKCLSMYIEKCNGLKNSAGKNA